MTSRQHWLVYCLTRIYAPVENLRAETGKIPFPAEKLTDWE